MSGASANWLYMKVSFHFHAMERADDVTVISRVSKIKLRVVSHLVRVLIPVSVQLHPRPFLSLVHKDVLHACQVPST